METDRPTWAKRFTLPLIILLVVAALWALYWLFGLLMWGLISGDIPPPSD